MKINDAKYSIGALVASGRFNVAPNIGTDMFDRIKNITFSAEDVKTYGDFVKAVGVTDEFKNVISTLKVEEGIIPAGFRPELVFSNDGALCVDLVRDIAFEKNGKRRPGNMLFAANTANPYEVATMKDFIAKITTNPSIIYSNFIKNPKANINNRFKTREEVMIELCKLAGPGVDISVELNNPFAPMDQIMEEISAFEEILTKYRLIVKVPHTGPLNNENVQAYLNGSFPQVYTGDAQSAFYGHRLAYELHNKGYRVNFTLMSDPHQTALGLLAKPAYFNAFVQKRYDTTSKMAELIDKLDTFGDAEYREQLHAVMMKNDLLASDDTDIIKAESYARQLLTYRNFDNAEGSDGLDSVRHSLRVLRKANLPETRLIICNTKTEKMYWDIDKVVTEPEFADMKQRVVFTAEPGYFAKFTGSQTIYNYQRSFLTAAD